jgi:predicted GNAT superfamily acetyltransferase
MEIRSLQLHDSQDVLRINAAAHPAVSRLDLNEFSRLMKISAFHLAMIDSGGVIVGYTLAFSKNHPYDGEEFLVFRSSIVEPFLYIDQIVIDNAFRGFGAGRMLYHELASYARIMGMAVLCCEVNISPPNPNSLAFHRRMGFTPAGELKTLDGRAVALLRREV